MSPGAGALYTTLAHAGFFPLDELATFAQPLSRLNGHPNRTKVAGVETNTGPLGHGLPVVVGCAVAAKMDGAAWRTYVLTGAGEPCDRYRGAERFGASGRVGDHVGFVPDAALADLTFR